MGPDRRLAPGDLLPGKPTRSSIPHRIGLWGSSYAGGHAIVLGATDRRLRAVVAQVPTISGYQQSLRRVAPDQVPALEAAFIDDERRQFRGEPPATQAVVSTDPATPAAYRAPDAVAFYNQPVPEGVWHNVMTVRSIACRPDVRAGNVDLARLPHTPADDRGPPRHHHRHRPRARPPTSGRCSPRSSSPSPVGTSTPTSTRFAEAAARPATGSPNT